MHKILISIWRFMPRIVSIGGHAGGICVLFVVLVIVAEITNRAFALVPFIFYADDISGFGVVFWTFIAAAYTMKVGAHIRMRTFVSKLPRRAQGVLEIIVYCLALVYISVLLVFFLNLFVESWTLQARCSAGLMAPLWIPQSIVVFGLFMLWLQTLVMGIRSITGLTPKLTQNSPSKSV